MISLLFCHVAGATPPFLSELVRGVPTIWNLSVGAAAVFGALRAAAIVEQSVLKSPGTSELVGSVAGDVDAGAG